MTSPSGVVDAAADRGRTVISPGVVRTIAGLAASAAPGVHSLRGGATRGLGMNRDRRNGDTTRSTGVHVEVGERHVALDVDVVVEYGASIPTLVAGVRSGVTGAVERLTGLSVVELSVVVADVHLPDVHSPDLRLPEPRTGARDSAPAAPVPAAPIPARTGRVA